MKRIAITLLALLVFSVQGIAQKYLDIFQNGVVTKHILAADIDSVSITESQPYIIKIWRDGNAIFTNSSNDIDSIKVSREGDVPLVYLGIIGFNQELYTKELDILATSTASHYKVFIDNLPRKDGTLLYYAVDNALDMLENQQIETPIKSVNLVTFTDGLDQGSIMMSSKYGSSNEYLIALGKRIAETKIKGLPINAYSIGLRGSDVVDEFMFKNNLTQLASSKDKAFEVNNMDDVHTRLQTIANQIISFNARQTFSVKIPGTDSGTLIRFTFDNLPANESQLYIEGTFNLQDRSLHNVNYHGIKANSGSTIQGTQNGIFVTYTFTGLQSDDKNGLIPINNIRQYYRMPSSPVWQVNSEFSPGNNTLQNLSHSGSAIILVVDYSDSFNEDFDKIKTYVNNFIDKIANNSAQFGTEVNINFKAPIKENGVSVVNIPYSRHNDDGSLMYGEGLSNYLLPVIVSGTTTNGSNFTVGIEESDTLSILNYERFQNRSDLYYVNMRDYATYPSTVKYMAGEDICPLDIQFDFKGIDMSQKWVLPIRTAGNDRPTINEPYFCKSQTNAILRIYPYNKYSGIYSAATLSMALKERPYDAIGGESPRGYVVDENTIFFYAGNKIDETRADRKYYKVFMRFVPNPLNSNTGEVIMFSDNPDMKFVGHEENSSKNKPIYSIFEQRDEVQPDIIHRYLIVSDIDYEFVDYTLVPGQERAYIVKGTVTMERKINTKITNPDDAIVW